MESRADEFRRLISAVLARFFAQNAQPPPSDAQAANFAARLLFLIAERGLPPPLAPGESGAPREMTEAEAAPLVARALGGADHPLLAEAARQLVKTCFYPEFSTCRESYRAVSPDGACRRQELTRARKRVSGSHCVDCPYWQELEPAAHAKFLAPAWCTDAAEFAAHRDVFLPEDYRALRRWIRAQAR